MSPLLRTLLAGTIAGIRAASATAAVSYDAVRNGRDLGGTLFSPLAVPELSLLLRLAAAGEMIADKLPFLGNRTDPLSLLGRATSGALCGAAIFAEDDEPVLAGAALGTLTAVVSTHASFRFRRALSQRLHLPNPIAGLVGDATAVGLGLLLSRER